MLTRQELSSAHSLVSPLPNPVADLFSRLLEALKADDVASFAPLLQIPEVLARINSPLPGEKDACITKDILRKDEPHVTIEKQEVALTPFLYAVKHNRLGVAGCLLKNPQIQIVADALSAIHLSIQNGLLAMTTLLLQDDRILSAARKLCPMLLNVAVTEGFVKIAELLLNRMPEMREALRTTRKHCGGFLAIAANFDQFEMLNYLASVPESLADLRVDFRFFNQGLKKEKNYSAIIKKLITIPAFAEEVANGNNVVLCNAIKDGDEDLFKAVFALDIVLSRIVYPAPPDAWTTVKTSVLALAAAKNRFTMVRKLLQVEEIKAMAAYYNCQVLSGIAEEVIKKAENPKQQESDEDQNSKKKEPISPEHLVKVVSEELRQRLPLLELLLNIPAVASSANGFLKWLANLGLFGFIDHFVKLPEVGKNMAALLEVLHAAASNGNYNAVVNLLAIPGLAEHSKTVTSSGNDREYESITPCQSIRSPLNITAMHASLLNGHVEIVALFAQTYRAKGIAYPLDRLWRNLFGLRDPIFNGPSNPLDIRLEKCLIEIEKELQKAVSVALKSSLLPDLINIINDFF